MYVPPSFGVTRPDFVRPDQHFVATATIDYALAKALVQGNPELAKVISFHECASDILDEAEYIVMCGVVESEHTYHWSPSNDPNWPF